MRKFTLLLSATLLVSQPGLAWGDHAVAYEVTITNITQGQTFTPILAATHRGAISLFELGTPVGSEMAEIAESGNIGPLKDVLDDSPHLVYATATSDGLLGPGQSVTLEIKGTRRFNRLSFAAMLIPTNDSFVAANAVSLPRWRKSFTVRAYDAGSEINDELCDSIPGPFCGGAGNSEGGGEGFVHISNGVHGVGDLDDAVFDWKNPVASVSVRRLR